MSLKIKTRKGNKLIDAYHASDTQVSDFRWRKLLHVTNQPTKETKPTLTNRTLVYQKLLDAGLNDYAEDLSHSLKPAELLQREVQHHQWLLSKLGSAELAFLTASKLYDDLKQSASQSNYQLTVDAAHLSEDNEQLRMIEQQRGQALEHLKQLGIDVTTIPPNAACSELVDLAFAGRLAKIPKRLDLGGIIEHLRAHKKLLALWAFDHYPQWIHLSGRLIKFEPPMLRWRCSSSTSEFPYAALGYQPLDVVTGSHGNRYYLYLDDDKVQCNCPSASFRQGECKHIRTWKNQHSNWMYQVAERRESLHTHDPWADYRTKS